MLDEPLWLVALSSVAALLANMLAVSDSFSKLELVSSTREADELEVMDGFNRRQSQLHLEWGNTPSVGLCCRGWPLSELVELLFRLMELPQRSLPSASTVPSWLAEVVPLLLLNRALAFAIM